VTGFVDVEAGEVDHDQLDVLHQVIRKFSKDDKFTFNWIDRSNAGNLADKFELSSKAGPSLVVYRGGKRAKYALSPEFDFHHIQMFLERVLTGDVKWNKL